MHLRCYIVAISTNKHRPKKNRPPYRRVVGTADKPVPLHDSGFEKIDTLAAALDALIVKPTDEIDGRGEGDQAPETLVASPADSVFLPPEIVDTIFRLLDDPIDLDLLLVCKTWYRCGLPFLYRSPELGPLNFKGFVEAVSSNDYVGTYVRELRLDSIIQSGKNSYTAKVLKRCSANLELFVAPQTAFGYAPMVSLRHCKQLRCLDLSLVSEVVDLRLLFLALRQSPELEQLFFPRSSLFCEQYDNVWPPRLWRLGLSGGISDEFIRETRFADTITHLSMRHCPFITVNSFHFLCQYLGPRLKYLEVVYPMPGLRPDALDQVLRHCPNLRHLSVSVDYLTKHVFDDHMFKRADGHFQSHPLEILDIDSSGGLGQAHKLRADDITLAILEDKIPKLRVVRVSSKMSWDAKDEAVSELASILDDTDANGGGMWII
ncbi:F-box protein [Yarrowia sp. B02]|nr:F-box protein [Yarrowia sp. B02]